MARAPRSRGASNDAGAPREPELAPGFHGRPDPRAGLTYRILRVTWRAIAASLRFRLVVEGTEHLPRAADGRPAGGWIAAVLPHRTWIDPFVPWIALPVEPRLAFFGDARTMARSPLRRWILARLGGVIPIPAGRDPDTVALHFEAAHEALAAGMVFCLMPETGPAAPLGSIRRLGSGIGYIAIRNGAPIVPIVLGGNDELYLGRRIIARILPALDPFGLAGIDRVARPTVGSPEERDAVHALLRRLAAAVGPDVADANTRTRNGPGARKRLRFLTTLFR